MDCAAQAPDFYWFPESSSVELARRITEAGPGHRLEVRISPEHKVTFRVVRAAVVKPIGDTGFVAVETMHEPDVNESFPCPPVCPD